MPSLLVTVGTDGSKDWVRTPDGQRYALGPVSVLTLVTKLSRNTKVARKTLDEFLKSGEAMLAVDGDQLWSLLAPRRTRWATGPFMASQEGRDPMTTRTATESREVKHLNATAQQASKLCDELQATLNKLADGIRRAGDVLEGPTHRDVDLFVKSLSGFRNDTLGWGGMAFSERAAAAKKAGGQALGIDSYEANTRTARQILAKAEKTVSTIVRLKSAGKSFDAARAQADVARVTTRVAAICRETELTESWVRDDLAKLATRNDELHRLFHPAQSEG
jgi:hypothetical protein